MTVEYRTQRLLDLEKRANDRINEYQAGLGKFGLVAVSAIVAVVGFLINSKQIELIQGDFWIAIGIYGTILMFGCTYIFATITIRLDAEYIATARDAQFKNNSEEHWKRSEDKLNLVDKFRSAVEITSVIGMLCLAIFAVNLISKIVSP